MHDHNRVNYNRDYGFTNIECNVHLLRDLQKTTDNLGHVWASDLKKLLEKTKPQALILISGRLINIRRGVSIKMTDTIRRVLYGY